MKKGQTVLESFIVPLTAEQFFAGYWPGRMFARHGRDLFHLRFL